MASGLHPKGGEVKETFCPACGTTVRQTRTDGRCIGCGKLLPEELRAPPQHSTVRPLREGILDHPFVNRRVFFPRPTDLVPDLVVDVDGAQLGCYVRHRHPGAGVLIHFHGNGELAAEYAADYADLFLGLGVNVCFAEYRGYGRSTGTPSLAAMRGDGERVVQALGIDPGRVVAFGRSLGSLYAMELAARQMGEADVAEKWPVRDELDVVEVRVEFHLRRKLSGYRGGLLVLHAAGDQVFDRSHAERLHAWGGGADKRLVVFPDGNHNTILFANYREYVREVRGFLRRVGVAADTGAEPKTENGGILE